MIFNPLFLSENSGSQIMAPKQTKMSNNKYLFSDIVKVVMSPLGESDELAKTNKGLIGSNIDLSLDDAQKPVQLKLKFLSDIDNEKAKLGLAEILPIEIAQLLIKDETESSEEKAVSYISQEPLTGELQNFVNNLIGPELIESHLNNKSGLLLSLEDSKSAVNLELAQVSSNKSVSENIVVQTLVVPEKSKLLSLMGDLQAKNGLFRIDNSQVQNLNSIGQSFQNLSETNGGAKPTLSVYSFNYGGDKFESLTKSIKLNNELKLGLSDVRKSEISADLSEGIKKVPLEKLSFVPSELKNNGSIPVANTKIGTTSNLISESLKLVRNESENTLKDFSVSKITIVKKTSDIIAPEKLIASNKPIGTLPNTELKRIDFGSQDLLSRNLRNIKSGNDRNVTDITNKFNNQNNTSGKTIVPDPQKIEVSDQVKVIKDLPKTGVGISKSVTSETNIIDAKNKIIDPVNLSEKRNSKTLEQIIGIKNTNNNKGDKTIIDQNSNPKNESPKGISPQVSLKDNGKANNSRSPNETNKVEALTNKISGENKIGTSEIKNDNSINLKSDKDFIENNKAGINKSSALNINENNSDLKIATKTVETPKSVLQEEKSIPANNTELKNEEPLANKKISVKVKGDVKSINEKLDTQIKGNQDSSQKENASTNSNSDKGNSSSGEFKNVPFANSHFNMNLSAENSFQQIMNESSGFGINNEIKSMHGIENESKHKVVKSIEVLKEVSKFISKQEKGSISFDIKPEQLGKMKITLDTADQVIRAKIEVDSEQAKQLIERNLDKLHQELTENGIELNSLNISLSYSKQQKEGEETMNNSNTKNENLGQVGETEEEEQKKTLGYNTYEYIA